MLVFVIDPHFFRATFIYFFNLHHHPYMYISWKILLTSCPKYHSTCGLILFRSCQFMSSQLFLQLDCQHIYRNKRKGYKNLNITNSFSEPLNSSIILPSPKTMERKTFLIIVFSCLAASKGKESF